MDHIRFGQFLKRINFAELLKAIYCLPLIAGLVPLIQLWYFNNIKWPLVLRVKAAGFSDYF